MTARERLLTPLVDVLVDDRVQRRVIRRCRKFLGVGQPVGKRKNLESLVEQSDRLRQFFAHDRAVAACRRIEQSARRDLERNIIISRDESLRSPGLQSAMF